jgi:methylmalonyl-CoA mutase
VVPKQDYTKLQEAGVAAIFPPGTKAAEAAEKLLDELNRRLGYAQRPAAE